MTEFQRLIDDLEGLKSTKLYENSFKVIDDCIHLLYSRKNYFEKLERIHTVSNLPKDENRCVYGRDYDEKKICLKCGNYHF
jgi:hypothetical protein